MQPKSDLVSAFMLLTRLPVGRVTQMSPTPVAAAAVWAWPLVGLLLGTLAGAVGFAAQTLGLPISFAAALTLFALIMMTGAMHEDGLADLADGFWGGFTPDRRLEIMRDSRTGAYGVIALALSLIMRWALLVEAAEQAGLMATTIVAAGVSRTPMAVLMAWLPNARADGLSKGSGVPTRQGILIGLGIAAVMLLSQGIPSAILAAALAGAAALGLGVLARAKIGGQTGDVLGASQQITEIVVLAALVSI